MHPESTHRVGHRIVRIHQPHVRPIVLGKAAANTEFGAEICVALCDGVSHLDHIQWEAYNEAHRLLDHVEPFEQRYGHYHEAVKVDGIYGTRENRKQPADPIHALVLGPPWISEGGP